MVRLAQRVLAPRRAFRVSFSVLPPKQHFEVSILLKSRCHCDYLVIAVQFMVAMSNDGISQDHLNGFSGFILAVFIVVSVFVIWPVHIPLPRFLQSLLLKLLKALRIIGSREFDSLSARKLRFPLSLETAPLIGVIILLASTTIDGSTIRLGVKGDENVKPYDVLVLFISLVPSSHIVRCLLLTSCRLTSPLLWTEQEP